MPEPTTNTAEPPAEIPEVGTRLATISRRPGIEELRVSLSSFKGFPFVSLRVWAAAGPGGQLLPLKNKGLSIRLSEVDQAIEALLEVRRAVAAGEAVGMAKRGA